MASVRKISVLTLLAALLLYSTHGFSHAVVTRSSLQIENVAPDKAAQVTLNFNSNIE